MRLPVVPVEPGGMAEQRRGFLPLLFAQKVTAPLEDNALSKPTERRERPHLWCAVGARGDLGNEATARPTVRNMHLAKSTSGTPHLAPGPTDSHSPGTVPNAV